MSRHAVLCHLALAVLLAPATPARADAASCTPIASLPFSIDDQGVYCLAGDLSTNMTEGAAITVNANNVLIDLAGHKLGGLAGGPETLAVGIYGSARQNITIRNGTIRGFLHGIRLEDSLLSRGHVVEDVRADSNLGTGISLSGHSHLVRRNHVIATGGMLGSFLTTQVSAILVDGWGSRIVDNDIDVCNSRGSPTAGIRLFAFDTIVANNRVSRCQVGIEFAGSSSGKYRDNLTVGVATPYVGGTDAGNNN